MDLGVAGRKADCRLACAGIATVIWVKGIREQSHVPATSEAGLFPPVATPAGVLFGRAASLTGVAPRTARSSPIRASAFLFPLKHRSAARKFIQHNDVLSKGETHDHQEFFRNTL